MEHPDNRPFPESYWVIPNRFLAGAYPGDFEPSHTRLKLTKLLNSGFDTYFNLTSENELPGYYSTLLEEAVFYNLQVTHQRFSITDKGLPSHMNMVKILDSIDSALAEGHKIYLHCWGGIGRTGTTVGCYLVRHGLSGQEALGKLASIYRTAIQSKLHPVSPETQEQFDFIMNWHEA
jgi:hypothetical protein